jgi:hypothetical protein
LGKDAHTAGQGAAAQTKPERKRAAAALFAALWPSLLGPEHGQGRRVQARRIWRRRLSHVALIATATGIGAVAAAPTFHPHGTADASYGQSGGRFAHAGPGGASSYGGHVAGRDLQRISVTLRRLQGDASAARFVAPADLPFLLASEAANDHGQDTAQGPEGQVSQSRWEPMPYSPRLAHYAGDLGGGGGLGGSGGGLSPGRSQDGGASPGLTDPGHQTWPQGPQTPDQPTLPHYTVDPDDAPHDGSDPQWPAGDWPPQTNPPGSGPLSPIPEPQAWLMMIGGFAAIGASLRARRRGPCPTR